MEEITLFEQMIESVEKSKQKSSGAGQNKACYPFPDHVVLKDHKETNTSVKKYILSDLQHQRETIDKLRTLHNINVPRLVYYTTKANTLFQIQERAQGKPLGFMSAQNYISYLKTYDNDKLIDIIERSEEGKFNTKLETYVDKNGNTLGKSTPLRDAIVEYNNNTLKTLLACDDSMLTKYLEDYKTLYVTYGFRIDNHCENFYFDKNKGITFIDLNVSQDNKNNRYLQTIDSEGKTNNHKKDTLTPVQSSANTDIDCLQEAINETFFLYPFADEETRVLNNLLVKKACRCAQNSPSFSNAVTSGKLEEYKTKTLNRRQEYASDEELKDFINVVKSNNNPLLVSKFQSNYSRYEYCMDFNTMDASFVLSYLEANPDFKPEETKEKEETKSSPFAKISNAFNSIVNHIKRNQIKQQDMIVDNEKTTPLEEFDDYRTVILEDPNFEFDPKDDNFSL